MISAREVETASFRPAGDGQIGYDEAAVDAFLDRAVATLKALEAGDLAPANALTSSDVVEATFPELSETTPGGYNLDDVDDLLDAVAMRLFKAERNRGQARQYAAEQARVDAANANGTLGFAEPSSPEISDEPQRVNNDVRSDDAVGDEDSPKSSAEILPGQTMLEIDSDKSSQAASKPVVAPAVAATGEQPAWNGWQDPSAPAPAAVEPAAATTEAPTDTPAPVRQGSSAYITDEQTTPQWSGWEDPSQPVVEEVADSPTPEATASKDEDTKGDARTADVIGAAGLGVAGLGAAGLVASQTHEDAQTPEATRNANEATDGVKSATGDDSSDVAETTSQSTSQSVSKPVSQPVSADSGRSGINPVGADPIVEDATPAPSTSPTSQVHAVGSDAAADDIQDDTPRESTNVNKAALVDEAPEATVKSDVAAVEKPQADVSPEVSRDEIRDADDARDGRGVASVVGGVAAAGLATGAVHTSKNDAREERHAAAPTQNTLATSQEFAGINPVGGDPLEESAAKTTSAAPSSSAPIRAVGADADNETPSRDEKVSAEKTSVTQDAPAQDRTRDEASVSPADEDVEVTAATATPAEMAVAPTQHGSAEKVGVVGADVQPAATQATPTQQDSPAKATDEAKPSHRAEAAAGVAGLGAAGALAVEHSRERSESSERDGETDANKTAETASVEEETFAADEPVVSTDVQDVKASDDRVMYVNREGFGEERTVTTGEPQGANVDVTAADDAVASSPENTTAIASEDTSQQAAEPNAAVMGDKAADSGLASEAIASQDGSPQEAAANAAAPNTVAADSDEATASTGNASGVAGADSGIAHSAVADAKVTEAPGTPGEVGWIAPTAADHYGQRDETVEVAQNAPATQPAQQKAQQDDESATPQVETAAPKSLSPNADGAAAQTSDESVKQSEKPAPVVKQAPATSSDQVLASALLDSEQTPAQVETPQNGETAPVAAAPGETTPATPVDATSIDAQASEPQASAPVDAAPVNQAPAPASQSAPAGQTARQTAPVGAPSGTADDEVNFHPEYSEYVPGAVTPQTTTQASVTQDDAQADGVKKTSAPYVKRPVPSAQPQIDRGPDAGVLPHTTTDEENTMSTTDGTTGVGRPEPIDAPSSIDGPDQVKAATNVPKRDENEGALGFVRRLLKRS